MDDAHFDTLARALAVGTPRRRALGLVAALPFAAAGLSALAPDDASAKRKKKKRKNKKKPTPPSCLPETAAQTCAGTCGAVLNNCGQTVQCAACGCAANQIRIDGVCTPCDVTCSDTSDACGDKLADKLTIGGKIVVCPGVYGGSFTLGQDVELIGAGAADSPLANTILDGLNTGRTVMVNAGVEATLRSLRITKGDSSTDPGDTSGGGILNTGLLTMTDCIVTGNKAGGAGGGGIQTTSQATLEMTRCAVTDNETLNGGGGLKIDGPATLTNCVITGNTASVGSDSYAGGGIGYNATGPLTLNTCQITGNKAANGGGIAVACQGDPLVLNLNGGVVKNNTSGDNRDITNCGTLNDNGSDITPVTCEDVSDGSTTGCGCPEGTACP